jgi:hypothetical protein
LAFSHVNGGFPWTNHTVKREVGDLKPPTSFKAYMSLAETRGPVFTLSA